MTCVTKKCLHIICGIVIILGYVAIVPAQEKEQSKKTVTVVPEPTLKKSGLHRFFFGDGYRKLWSTSIEAEYLDLRNFAGGLTPTGTGKGMQSLGLRFIGADGRPYTFRPLKKSLLELLPEFMHDTFFEDIVEDQLKSAFPTAPPVVPVLLDAAGVLHNTPKIIVIPDDPLLGEYRELFAGQVGTIEQWPNEGKGGSPGFEGATEVHSTDELIEALKSDPKERVDAQNFLAARFVDLVIGDWDRHRGQWRWANVGEGSPPAFVPIPEDRDQAFAKYDGAIMGIVRSMVPQLTNFGPKFNSILGMTWNGRTVDRQLLVGLSKSDWEAIARSVQSKLEDSVFEEALMQLPSPHYDLVAEEIVATLKVRRDKLLEIADKYYRLLAGEVELMATHTNDVVEAVRLESGALEVSIFASEGGEKLSSPYYHRIFDPNDTKDVRISIHGGNDQVNIMGAGPNKIKLRIICDSGQDKLTDTSAKKGTKVYDSRREGGVVVQGAKVDRRPYTPPKPVGFQLPPRDWGKQNLWSGAFNVNGDIGLLFGLGFNHQRFGFRRNPYASSWTASLAYSTKLQHVRFKTGYSWTRENSKFSWGADFMLSGIETLNYYGLGNETSDLEDDDLAVVNRRAIHLEPVLNIALTPKLGLRFGAILELSQTSDNPDTILGIENPYGTDEFWQAGFTAQLLHNALDNTFWPSQGWYFRTRGDYYPEWLGIEEGPFGSFEGLLAGVLRLPGGFVVASRVAGRKVWGNFPYFHGAYIGGNDSLRGYDKQRFAGDASLYANLELRYAISRFRIHIPGEWGVFGFVDTGRVFLSGEASKKWHTGYGGGIWIAPFIRQFTMSLAVAGSDEGMSIYFGFGFGY
ncbi:BamA/TamA family outer membrane protein [Acidobacteriota bacterium]